jgi:hypothetical protein
MSKQFRTSIEVNPIAPKGIFDEVFKVMETGAPIQVGGASLKSFERLKTVDAITLPGKPVDKDAARVILIKRKMIPEKRVEIPQGAREAMQHQKENAGAAAQ